MLAPVICTASRFTFTPVGLIHCYIPILIHLCTPLPTLNPLRSRTPSQIRNTNKRLQGYTVFYTREILSQVLSSYGQNVHLANYIQWYTLGVPYTYKETKTHFFIHTERSTLIL